MRLQEALSCCLFPLQLFIFDVLLVRFRAVKGVPYGTVPLPVTLPSSRGLPKYPGSTSEVSETCTRCHEYDRWPIGWPNCIRMFKLAFRLCPSSYPGIYPRVRLQGRRSLKKDHNIEFCEVLPSRKPGNSMLEDLRLLVVLKNGVFWDVTPCGSCKDRRFRGT
jgi:hypothetical protein